MKMAFAQSGLRLAAVQLVAAIALGACHAVAVPNDTINFNGPINAKSVTDLERMLRGVPDGSVKWLVITSAGGDADAGFRFGRLIHDFGLSVRVRGYCHSACAQSVFLAGKVKEVEPGSLVLFHGTASTVQRLHAVAGDKEGALLFGPVALQEDQFLDLIGVRADLTALAIRELRPFCVIIDGTRPAEQVDRYGYATQFAAYAVPRSMIEEMAGGPVHGYWPSSPGELAATLRELPFNEKFTVAWAGGPLPMRGQKHEVPTLTQCSAAVTSIVSNRGS